MSSGNRSKKYRKLAGGTLRRTLFTLLWIACVGLCAPTALAQNQMQIIAGSTAFPQGITPGGAVQGIICSQIDPTPSAPVPLCEAGYSGDGGLAVQAQLYLPFAVAASGTGTVYIADGLNGVVRAINPSGTISTFAVLPLPSGSGAVTATSVAVDPSGNVFFGDNFGNVYKNTTSSLFTNTGSGTSIEALTTDASGNVYILATVEATYSIIGKYDTNGNGIGVIVGSGGIGGPAAVLFYDPLYGIAVDATGNVYTYDAGKSLSFGGTIVKIDTNDNPTAISLPTTLSVGAPAGGGLAVDPQGNFYFVTNSGSEIQKFDPTTATLTAFAGTGTNGFNNGNNLNPPYTVVTNYYPYADAPSPATATDINQANGIYLAQDGTLYVADTSNNLVRKVVSNPAGTGCQGCGPTSLTNTDPIPTGNITSTWALNPSTHKLYVVYPYAASGTVAANVVTVFNTNDDTVLANIPVGNSPGAIAVDSTNNVIYVGNGLDNTVSVIDGTSNLVTATVAVAGSPLAIAVDPGFNKAYVSISNGTSVSVISGPSGGNAAAFLHNISVFVPSALAVDTIRHIVYVRFLGPSETGEENYSLAVIDANTDTVTATPSISYGGSTSLATDSIAVDESTGKVVIGDGFDQAVRIYDPSSQGFSYYYPSFYAFHVAVDSINQIYYFADGYGDTAYLDELAVLSGSITQTPSPGNISGTCSASGSVIGVDATTDQAYITTCDGVNGAVLSLFDGAAKKVIATLSLGTPPNTYGSLSGSFALLVDSSNSDPTKHSAYVENSIANQIDVINGPTPAPRPAITISPNPVSFGAVGVGQNSAPVILTITNSGQAPLTSLNAVVVNTQDPNSIQIISNTCELPLAEGSSCSLFLTFTPSQVENLSAAIKFLDDSPDTPQAVVITGSGVPATGALTISPLSLPPGVVSSPYTQLLTASGGSGSTLTFSVSNGALPPGLTLYPAGQLNGTPTTANTYNFTVTVTDSGTGKTGSQLYSLTITSTLAAQTTAAVYGSGSSGIVSFGNIEVNEPSGTQQFTIENTGLVNLQILGVTLTGTNASDFSESDNCTTQLWQAYQSCTVFVSFLPTVAPVSSEVAELVFSSNAAIPLILLSGTSAPALGAPSSLPTAVSVDNGNPPNPTAQSSFGSSASPGTSAVSSGGQFVAFTVRASNLPGPPLSTSGSLLNSMYLRSTCAGTTSGCEESTSYISYGPATGPGSNSGAACNNTSAGGYSGSNYPAIDTTGEFVAFTSDTCGFTGSVSGNANQIFLRDVLHSNTSLVSVDASGQPFAAGADHAAFSISANARFFAFQTTSSNVVSGVSNASATDEVYWRDVCTGRSSGCNSSTLLVSQDGNGNAANNTSQSPSISANGRYVAYASQATNIVPNLPNNTSGAEQVYLYDTCAGAVQGCNMQTTAISVDANGNAAGGTNPSVSGDGRFVAFVSSAPTLVSVTNPPASVNPSIFLHDTCYSNGVQVSSCTPSTTLLSATGGVPANGSSSSPFVTADGRLITFTSSSGNLNSSGSYAKAIYEYDTCQANGAPVPTSCTPGLFLISVDSNGNLLTQGSDGAEVDATDQYFSFSSNVPSSSGYGAAQVYLGPTTLTRISAPLVISPTSLAGGTAGVSYGPVTLTATGGTGTVTFAVTAGALPPGLTLSSAGVLSGTPTQTGTFSFTVTATDSANDTGSQPYTLTIGSLGSPASIAATAGTPQSAMINSAFATPLQGTVEDSNGNLLSGVTVTFTAPDSGASGTFAGSSSSYTTTTNTSGVATATTFTANGTAGTYTVTAAASGVATPANFSLTNSSSTGPPPAVVTDNETITVADTETFPDVFDSEIITVADTVKVTACTAFTISPSGTLTPSATVGTSYSQQFTPSETSTFTWATSGTLPAGLSMNPSTGVLSGTPTAAGTFTFTVTATDQNGCQGSANVSLTVNSAPTGTTTTTITSTSSTYQGLPLPANFALVGNPITVNVKVLPPSGSAPATGTVTVTAGTTAACQATLTSTSSGTGSCTLTIPQLGSGSTAIVAVYSPDAASSGLLSSSSSPVTESIVQITACGSLPTSQTSAQGTTVTFTFSTCLATDVLTAPGAVVTGCPPDAQCSATITPVSLGVYKVVVTIVLGGTGSIVPLPNPRPWGDPWPLIPFWVGMFLAIVMALQLARQNRARPRLLYAAGLLIAVLLSGLSGCTSASVVGPGGGGGGTPLNTYTMNAAVTAGNFSTTVHLTLIVTK